MKIENRVCYFHQLPKGKIYQVSTVGDINTLLWEYNCCENVLHLFSYPWCVFLSIFSKLHRGYKLLVGLSVFFAAVNRGRGIGNG